MRKTINYVLGRSCKTIKTQQIKLTDGTLINNCEQIATEFNNYFNTIPQLIWSNNNNNNSLFRIKYISGILQFHIQRKK